MFGRLRKKGNGIRLVFGHPNFISGKVNGIFFMRADIAVLLLFTKRRACWNLLHQTQWASISTKECCLRGMFWETGKTIAVRLIWLCCSIRDNCMLSGPVGRIVNRLTKLSNIIISQKWRIHGQLLPEEYKYRRRTAIMNKESCHRMRDRRF